MKTPFEAANEAVTKGILRLRLCFVSRSTASAQDDKLEGVHEQGAGVHRDGERF